MENKKVKIIAENGIWHNGIFYAKDEMPEVANAEILIAGKFAEKAEEKSKPATIDEAKAILEAAEKAMQEAEIKLSQAIDKDAKKEAGKTFGAAKKAFEKAKSDLTTLEKGNE